MSSRVRRLPVLYIVFGFDILQGRAGALALLGEDEFIKVKLFDEVDHDRKITGEGNLIMCYDLKMDTASPPLFD